MTGNQSTYSMNVVEYALQPCSHKEKCPLFRLHRHLAPNIMVIRGVGSPEVKDGIVEAEQLMTAADAAKVLGVVPNSVRRMTDTGELPSIRTVGGFRLIKQSDVERLAAARAASTDSRITKPALSAAGKVTA